MSKHRAEQLHLSEVLDTVVMRLEMETMMEYQIVPKTTMVG